MKAHDPKPPKLEPVAARQHCAELLDGWATEHEEAAAELKALALQLVRDEGVVGWRVFGAEIGSMEV